MSGSRIELLRGLVAGAPADPRPRLFLAHELFKVESWEEAADQFRAYIAMEPGDEGSAWRSLGLCLEKLDRPEEAAEAYRRGIVAAERNGHATLAGELRFLLEDLLG